MKPSRKQVQAAAEIYAKLLFNAPSQITIRQVLPRQAASGWVVEFQPLDVGTPVRFEVLSVPATHFGFVHKGLSFTRSDPEGD